MSQTVSTFILPHHRYHHSKPIKINDPTRRIGPMESLGTISRNTHQHGSLLLSLPLELRYAFWTALLELIHTRRNAPWFKRPRNEFTALLLTCRQLHHELLTFRTPILITWDKFYKFCCALSNDYPSTIRLNNYRSLTIQFRFDASRKQYDLLTRALFACRLNLEELHLSFAGQDMRGVSTHLHGCAYAEESGREKGLIPDGQHIHMMVSMLNQLTRMVRLRILVISNLNLQLIGRWFTHKSRLEYLHITADPRSAVHTYFTHQHRLAILFPPAYVLPVKVLHICANSMLTAVRVPVSCATTLEHLTWTVPDASLGSNIINARLFSQTLQLINFLALHAPKLKTLRICIAGNGHCDRDRAQETNNLRLALTIAVTALQNLRKFELHIARKLTFHGRIPWSLDILNALPPRIERFYTNDQLVLPRDLHSFITNKYLSASTGPAQPTTSDPVELRLERWDPQPPLSLRETNSYSENSRASNCEQFKISLNPTSYSPRYFDGELKSVGTEIVRSCRTQTSALFLPGIIGEDHRRKDYIPLRSGNLKFVAYEFHNPEYKCRTGGTGETLTHMMLRLNGRLLDRERNRHLAVIGTNRHIPPTLSYETQTESALYSADLGISTSLWRLYEQSRSYTERREYFMEELMSSQFRNDERYFGNEEQAYQLFWDERVAKPESLKPLTYPYFVDTEQDNQCHWMCPDADVPTLAQLDRAKTVKRA